MLKNKNDKFEKCICVRCPSHSRCMKKKMLGMFCMGERSAYAGHRRGCACRACPIAKENNLTGVYYCETGKRP